MNLPNRKSIRLKDYDYSSSGAYFVTICTKNREEIFGSVGVVRGQPKMILNNLGKIVESVWQSLPQHHPVELDQFQIMPNHIHMIIIIGSRLTGGSRPAPTLGTTLGTILGLFKSTTTKQIRIMVNNPQFPVWQRNYYEHIIRNDQDLEKISQYIIDNPQMWERDRNNQENLYV